MFAIEFENVSKVYKKDFKTIDAVRNISLKIPVNSIYSIIGPNGAGKTTSLKMITGITPITKGKIKIFGNEKFDNEKKKIFGFLPEFPSFFSNITPWEFLEFVLFTSEGKIDKRRIDSTLKNVGLYDERDEKVRKFSKGMVQRLGIAQAIIHNPEIIILDEPFSGLDPIAKEKLKKIIFSLYDEGKTIILSSHNLTDIENLSTHISLIKKGELMLSEDMETLKTKAVYFVEFKGDIVEWETVKTEIRGGRRFISVNDKKNLWHFLEFAQKENIDIISVRLSIKNYLEEFYG
jgi:ABC-2 type transport system ATP-binding protein